VAASGGYYIAMPANAIVAEPSTLTGSIGVVLTKFAIGGTLNKLGLNLEGVSNGKYADLYSPTRPFTPEERGMMMANMQATYDTFVEKAAQGRNTTPERIDAIGQGRVCDFHCQTAGQDPSGIRRRNRHVSRTAVVLRRAAEPVRTVRLRRHARGAAGNPRSARTGVAHRAAAGVSARRTTGNHAECVREVNRV
jgi:peptidase S49-like protein